MLALKVGSKRLARFLKIFKGLVEPLLEKEISITTGLTESRKRKWRKMGHQFSFEHGEVYGINNSSHSSVTEMM